MLGFPGAGMIGTKGCCSGLDCSHSNRLFTWQTRHAFAVYLRCLRVSSSNFKDARILALRKNIPRKACGWVLTDLEGVSGTNAEFQAEVFKLLSTLRVTQISKHWWSRRDGIIITPFNDTVNLLQLHKSQERCDQNQFGILH